MMVGTDVENVQTRLAYIGFDPGTINSVYNKQTEDAVKKLQSIGGRTSAVLPMMVLLATTRRKLFAIR